MTDLGPEVRRVIAKLKNIDKMAVPRGERWADMELDEILPIAIVTRGYVKPLLNLVILIERIAGTDPSYLPVGVRIWQKRMAELNLHITT